VAQQIGGFISRLKNNIRPEVQASRPTSLTAAVGLARLYEAQLQAQRQVTNFSEFKRVVGPANLPLPLANLARNRSPMVRKLSPAKLKDRRDRGLCFNCDDKFSLGHRCKKLFLIEGVYEEDPETPACEENQGLWEEDEPEIPEISLYAILGVQLPQTMRIAGTIKRARVVMLADTESTHNFLSTHLAEQLGLEPDKHTAFDVLVANGGRLSSKGKCSVVQVWLQGTLFTLEFFLIDLRGYDSVLGAQWLRTLGPILWDFSKLCMSFTWQGKEVMLVGLAAPKNQLVEGPKMMKEIRRYNEGILLQLFMV
jgi:hypothetical protein